VHGKEAKVGVGENKNKVPNKRGYRKIERTKEGLSEGLGVKLGEKRVTSPMDVDSIEDFQGKHGKKSRG
jgi:hypothetical protein